METIYLSLVHTGSWEYIIHEITNMWNNHFCTKKMCLPRKHEWNFPLVVNSSLFTFSHESTQNHVKTSTFLDQSESGPKESRFLQDFVFSFGPLLDWSKTGRKSYEKHDFLGQKLNLIFYVIFYCKYISSVCTMFTKI